MGDGVGEQNAGKIEITEWASVIAMLRNLDSPLHSKEETVRVLGQRSGDIRTEPCPGKTLVRGVKEVGLWKGWEGDNGSDPSDGCGQGTGLGKHCRGEYGGRMGGGVLGLPARGALS